MQPRSLVVFGLIGLLIALASAATTPLTWAAVGMLASILIFLIYDAWRGPPRL